MDRGAYRAKVHGGHKESDLTEQLTLSLSLIVREVEQFSCTFWPSVCLLSESEASELQSQVCLGQRVDSGPLFLNINGLQRTNSINISVSFRTLSFSCLFRDMFAGLNPSVLCGFASSQGIQCL